MYGWEGKSDEKEICLVSCSIMCSAKYVICHYGIRAFHNNNANCSNID